MKVNVRKTITKSLMMAGVALTALSSGYIPQANTQPVYTSSIKNTDSINPQEVKGRQDSLDHDAQDKLIPEKPAAKIEQNTQVWAWSMFGPFQNIPNGWDVKLPQNYNQGASSNMYSFGQCTWYAYNRVAQVYGHNLQNGNRFGNGGDWGDNGRAFGFETSDQPHEGWLVSFKPGVAGADGTYGHVAFVEAVHGDTFLVSESNVVGPMGTVSFREISVGAGMTFVNPNK